MSVHKRAVLKKSSEVLMVKFATLGWTGAGQEQGKSRVGPGQEQSRCRVDVGAG